MHNLAKELTVSLQEDRPGTLASATKAIAKAGINIDGYAEIEGSLHVLNGTRRPGRGWSQGRR